MWTCAACETRLQLDTAGEASAPAGYCAAGAHHVKEPVRYAAFAGASDTPPARRPVALPRPEPITDKFGQLGLF